MGPNHRVPLRGAAIPESEIFLTPLGGAHISSDMRSKVLDLDFIKQDEQVHFQEHCLEVQLPFLQYLLDDFEILPVIVSSLRPQQVETIIDLFWQEQCLVVISSDLSHYLEYSQAQKSDQQTRDNIQSLNTDIQSRQACGACAINGALSFSKNQSLQAKTIQLKNSGDSAGDKQRVVGYGAFCFI